MVLQSTIVTTFKNDVYGCPQSSTYTRYSYAPPSNDFSGVNNLNLDQQKILLLVIAGAGFFLFLLPEAIIPATSYIIKNIFIPLPSKVCSFLTSFFW